MNTVKRRRWLWIGAGVFAVLVICAAALLVPPPLSRVESEIEQLARDQDLVRTEPRIGRISAFVEEGRGTAYTSSDLTRQQQYLLVDKFARLMYRYRFDQTTVTSDPVTSLDRTIARTFIKQSTDDWTMVELVCVSTEDTTETTLVVWRKTQGLWERFRSRLGASPVP